LSISQKTILVVDDEKLLRWSLRQKLESAGYHVLEADSGEAALSRFRHHLPDLVTLDIRLPDTHGLKLLLEIKKRSPFPRSGNARTTFRNSQNTLFGSIISV